ALASAVAAVGAATVAAGTALVVEGGVLVWEGTEIVKGTNEILKAQKESERLDALLREADRIRTLCLKRMRWLADQLKPDLKPEPKPDPKPEDRRKPKRKDDKCQPQWEDDIARCDRIANDMVFYGYNEQEIEEFEFACHKRAEGRKQ